jgi:hypothetical protein
VTIIDAAGIAGFVIAAAGVCDLIVQRKSKRAVTYWLIRVSRNWSTGFSDSTKLFDRVFGVRLFSGRSIVISTLFSLFSVVFSYIVAYFTSDSIVRDHMLIFPQGFHLFSVSAFLLCIILSFVADFLSYVQTRVFVRAIERYKSLTVVFVLLISDGFAILSIFMFTFAVSRAVIYAIVISYMSAPTANVIGTYIPTMTRAISKSFEASHIPEPGLLPFGEVVARADSPGHLALLVRAASKVDQSLPNRALMKNVQYDAELACADPNTAMTESLSVENDFLSIILNDKAYTAMIRKNNQVVEIVDKARRDFLVDSTSVFTRCKYKVVHIIRRERPVDLFRSVTPTDFYLASLERTMYDIYLIVAFKFFPYLNFNPLENTKSFISNLATISSVSPFGVIRTDYNRETALADYSTMALSLKSEVRIPFTCLVASSFTPTILLAAYLIYLTIVVLSNRLSNLLGKAISIVRVRSAVFSTIAITFSILLIGFILSGDVLVEIWRLLWS